MTTLIGLHLPLRFLLLLLLYCLFASSEFIYKNPVHGLVACHPHQIQALLQFKDEFDSHGCNQTDYFNGVRCDNTTGVITKLQLPSGCLSGTLKPNSSLFRLHHLRHLNLSHNDFTSSSLPFEFGNLNRLEVLSLSSNGFIGQVPSSFNNLSLLSYLVLSHNELTGSFPPIQNLTKLSLLVLQNNHFSTLEPNNSLFEFHHLRFLDLSHNNFISIPLPFEFGNLNKLEVLALSYNGFVGQVPSSFNSLNRLTDLYLGYNKLTGNFPHVHNLTKLSLLSLANNDFFGTIPSSLFTMPFLSTLVLNENHFSGPIEIPNSSFSPRLEGLFLRGNNFEDEILKPISKLTNLKTLGLHSLNISQPIDLSVFSSLKHLTGLDLSGNSVSPISLSSDLGMPSSMEVLYLSGCNITEFPKILKPLQNLTFINLSNNQIKGKVPRWFWSLPRLTVVNFVNNSLDGFEGSDDVLLNSSVQTLFLDSNSFEGTLPNLPLSVNYFSAWNNNFKGHIPLSICDRNSLMFLDLSYNHFNGPIPPCHIPLSLAKLTDLQSLDLSRNQLSGTIPNGLKTLTFLAFINVSHNQLKGEIPQGTQITGQSKSSFEGNAGLCGLPLEESCFGTNAGPTQQPKEEEEEEEEEVLNWKGVAIGYGLGVLFGLAIAQIIASYKPEWLAKITCLNKRKTR
ncbi:hypothetical protein AALP_AA6G066700 [Arabis alpina]|uniref:Disease resistance R13L4/SHOC-2-like LRR domain-containing protein n=1 Tax=Arabis alpina TaxID=50452 RepID=A0A087GMI8_ARAAL|nr:hypothetical protein AALP_AA6G066700 [Arabis alpina]